MDENISYFMGYKKIGSVPEVARVGRERGCGGGVGGTGAAKKEGTDVTRCGSVLQSESRRIPMENSGVDMVFSFALSIEFLRAHDWNR